MITIIPLPALKDNYIWVGINTARKEAFIVDPGEAAPVLDYLQKEALQPIAILLTHKHVDHTGGVFSLLEKYPNIAIYASKKENLSIANHPVKEGDIIQFTKWPLQLNVIDIPAHTLGHVAYLNNEMLFCGDTLFSAGCGRVFEGTHEEMIHALLKLSVLPANTKVYAGHEYTLANLVFAKTVEPKNKTIEHRLLTVKQLRKNNLPTLPSTIAIEKETNPFLRCANADVIQAAEKKAGNPLTSPTAVFRVLRDWKDHFISPATE